MYLKPKTLGEPIFEETNSSDMYARVFTPSQKKNEMKRIHMHSRNMHAL